ncbi:patatin-like protein [Streptomyces sp. 5-8]|uniref:Patatin-like protein n=1 Tax=Streptomyces musisoli TaxID=2802280 RepID=A0ABS1PBS4_9ACTN|nr:patatin-like protein [Streptomyces musisoli]MBL1109346.1 patatin-like protein [Streptomyces musisoli]
MEVIEETRLALVLNGGVSLAVWMGGVTHELDLLRRASRSLQTGVPERVKPEERAGFELWQRVIREAHTHVVVDVVAGTSAGGLNGSFLATAIGRGTDLPDLRATWQSAAALTGDRLLKAPPYNSLLDGQYFQDEVGRILDSMCGSEREAEPVTLFVTATALDGLPEYLQDSFGGRFQVADHRRLYRFQHNPDAMVVRKTGVDGDVWKPQAEGRRDFLDDTVLPRLRLAARASAGFPVAFAPVDESPLLLQRVQPAPEIPSRGRDRASWIVDGGVLNNAPFGPVLEAISDRQVNGPVRRVVVYIVPSSGITDPHEQNRPPCKAAEWPSVLGTAVSYPREADFRSGAAELQERMNRESFDRHLHLFRCQIDDAERQERVKAQRHVRRLLRRTAETCGEVEPGTKDQGCDLVELASSLFIHYRKSRVRGVLWKVRQLREEGRGVLSLARIRLEDVDALLKSRPELLWVPDTADALHASPGDEWTWGGSVAERLIWTLVSDIERRLRDRITGPHEEAGCSSQDPAALTHSLGQLSSCVGIVRAVQETIYSQIRNASQAGGDPAQRLDPEQGPTEMVNRVYKSLGVAGILGEQVRRAIEEYNRAVYGVDATDRRAQEKSEQRAKQTLSFCLAAEVVAGAAASSEQLAAYTPLFEFLRLGPDEYSPLFPHDKFAPLGDRKLYGIRLNHFGAFVKPEWRASDFTWGRLDACHHLLRLFIADHQERKRTETKMHEAILLAENFSKGAMEKNLKELAEPDDSRLFKRYLASPDGRYTFGRVVEGALSMLASKGSPERSAPAEAGKIMFWRSFGRRLRFTRGQRISSLNQLLLSRLIFWPARSWWWRRVRKNPKKIMGITLQTTILAVVTCVLVPFFIGEAIRHGVHESWSWQAIMLAAPAILAGVLVSEYVGTGIYYFLKFRIRRRRAERRAAA